MIWIFLLVLQVLASSEDVTLSETFLEAMRQVLKTHHPFASSRFFMLVSSQSHGLTSSRSTNNTDLQKEFGVRDSIAEESKNSLSTVQSFSDLKLFTSTFFLSTPASFGNTSSTRLLLSSTPVDKEVTCFRENKISFSSNTRCRNIRRCSSSLTPTFIQNLAIKEVARCLQDAQLPIMLLLLDSDTQPPKIEYKIRSYLNYEERISNYILVLYDKESLENIILKLQVDLRWNPRAKFLVMAPGIPVNVSYSKIIAFNILDLLWKVDVYNSLVFIPVQQSTQSDKSTVKIYVYSWIPYSSQKECGSGNVVLVAVWTHSQSFRLYNPLFSNKVIQDLRGCTVWMSTLEYEPYVMGLTIDNSTGKPIYNFTAGLEVRMVDLIAERTNFRIMYRPPPELQWHGIMKDLWEHKAEIGFGTCSAVPYEIDVEYSYPYTDNAFVWIVPCGAMVPPWKALFRIFSREFWIAILMTFISCVTTLWFIYSRKHSLQKGSESIMFVFLALLSQAYPLPMQSHIVRLVVFIVLIYSMQINVAYQSLLVSFLSNALYDVPVSSEEELLSSNLDWGYSKVMNRRFSVIMDKRLSSRRVECEVQLSCMDRLAFERNFAYTVKQAGLEYLTARYYTKRGRPLVCQFPKVILSCADVIFLRKGSPLRERVDEISLRAVQGGFVVWWRRQLRETALRLAATADADLRTQSSLSLSEMSGVFYVLLLGLATAGVVTTVEVTTSTVMKWKKSRQLANANTVIL